MFSPWSQKGWKGGTIPYTNSAGPPDAAYDHSPADQSDFRAGWDSYWGKGASRYHPKGGRASESNPRWLDDKNPPWWEPALENRGFPFATWREDVN